MVELRLSENAVRHHLAHLEKHGFLQAGQRRVGIGRPTKMYTLTVAAEGLFPKRYQELLFLFLSEARDERLLIPLVDGVVERLSRQLTNAVVGSSPEARLASLIDQLDYGEMLGELKKSEGGWELLAYNCIYRETGFRFKEVCDLLPRVITQVTGLPAERPICQRDGARACMFTVSQTPNE